MSIDIRWGVENHLIQTTLHGSMTLEELIQLTDRMLQLVDSSSHPIVHFMVDVRQIQTYLPLQEVIKLRPHLATHPGSGWLILISNNKTLTFISTLVNGTKSRMRAFQTIEEALAFLRERDDTAAYPESLPVPELDQA